MSLGATINLSEEKGRMRITGTATTGGVITITRRHPSGRTVSVRGADLLQLSGGTFLVYDHEMPIGIPVTYTAAVYDAADTQTPLDTSDPVTITWNPEDEWLKDPLEPIRNIEIRVNDMSEFEYASPTAVHTVLGRPDPVTIGEVRQAATGEVTFVTLSKDERDRFHYITSSGHVLLLQSSQESGIGNMYVASLGLREVRVGTRDQPERLWTMTYQEVGPPVGAGASTTTWQDVIDTYPTWQDVVDSNTSWIDMIENLGSSSQTPILAWRGA